MHADKIIITNDRGERVEASAPVIVSASRSTDIPAFYSEWFFHRLKVGHSVWTNPFNGVRSYVSYRDTRFIVFWSKNPAPLLEHLDYLDTKGIGCYIQFTLNDYEREGIEKGVPPIDNRIDTFRRLVDRLGPGHVVWRFDPMLLTDEILLDGLLDKVSRIGDRLNGYTEKLVFSYADIESYRRVKSNLTKSGIHYHEWTEPEMIVFARRLAQLNQERGWGYTLATCGEKIDISQFGIKHNRCIDDDLIIRLAWHDAALMKHLSTEIRAVRRGLFDDSPSIPDDAIMLDTAHYAVKKRNNRDSGQRKFCGCITAKDIGQYNTCPHMCEYCYANSSKEAAVDNFKMHKHNPLGESITGQL